METLKRSTLMKRVFLVFLTHSCAVFLMMEDIYIKKIKIQGCIYDVRNMLGSPPAPCSALFFWWIHLPTTGFIYVFVYLIWLQTVWLNSINTFRPFCCTLMLAWGRECNQSGRECEQRALRSEEGRRGGVTRQWQISKQLVWQRQIVWFWLKTA